MPGMIWGTQDVAWAKLDKIFTPGFYNYMKDPANFTKAPALTGNAYEDMHYALKSNNVCTGWQPQHRIQFATPKAIWLCPTAITLPSAMPILTVKTFRKNNHRSPLSM